VHIGRAGYRTVRAIADLAPASWRSRRSASYRCGDSGSSSRRGWSIPRRGKTLADALRVGVKRLIVRRPRDAVDADQSMAVALAVTVELKAREVRTADEGGSFR
jgi:hypothetical protein